FSIQAIDLRKASSQGDSLLTRFLSLKQLKTVYLGHGDYTLRGLAVLGRVKGLETLNIGELRFAEGTAALESDIAPAVVVKEEPAAVIVARWALSNGGEIAIRNGSSTRKIAALDAVPKQSFELVA